MSNTFPHGFRRTMLSWLQALAVGALFCCPPLPSLNAQAPQAAPPKIIIKVDDLKMAGGGMPPQQWGRLLAFARERNIKMNFGVICETLETAKPRYLDWLKEVQASGLVELWLHAYDHKDHAESDGYNHAEFEMRPYDEQKRRIEACQKLIKNAVGVQFTAFGPPGGGNLPAKDRTPNADLMRVIQEDPFIKAWMYSTPIDDEGEKLQATGKITVLDRVWHVNIEQPLFQPNSAALEKGYNEWAAKRRYFVIQGHPTKWDDAKFEEFVKIVDFLTAKGCEFVKVSEYAQTLKPASK